MITRRDAVRGAAVTALSYSRILGANERIGLGVIGAGIRGTQVSSVFQRNSDVEVRAICDIYAVRIETLLPIAPQAKTAFDHRQLLDLKEVDAVLIAVPDHWHKDIAIDSMQAGKDVYLEKPFCRTREEAPLIVQAARATNRVCQVGLQQRSGPIYLQQLDRFIRSGALGKINHIDALWQQPMPMKLPAEPAQQPGNLDWLRFLGPVKYRDWNPAQYLSFRSFLDFNGGRMTDFGHHWMDVVNMYMGERPPSTATTVGGILFDLGDGRTAPDTVSVLFEFDGFTVLFQSNAYSTPDESGITFHGEGGRLFISRTRWAFTPPGVGAVPIGEEIPGDITNEHVRNFLDCVKSRQRTNADPSIAAISVLAPLLAVQSYVEKRRIQFDPDRLTVVA